MIEHHRERHFFRDESALRAVMCAISPEEVFKEHITQHMMPDGCGWTRSLYSHPGKFRVTR
jgi:hypothetical protein